MSPTRPPVFPQRGPFQPRLAERDESGPTSTGGAESSRRPDPSLGVHLLAGLPTEAVRRGFERAGEVMPVVPLTAPFDRGVADPERIGVLLPPFVEPSFLVESWQEWDFLAHRFGRPAHIASVSTFVDVGRWSEHLASAAPLTLHGWGRSDLDRRTVADILVGQVESATRLVLVGEAQPSAPLARHLDVLNPAASRTRLGAGAGGSRLALARAFAAEGSGAGDRGAPGSDAAGRSVRVVPPWLELLQGDCDGAPGPELFVYRRARPFDPGRFTGWLENPPRCLLRGKGQVWLASEPDWSFGYSCAGSVHRLFPGGRWWASRSDGSWPDCATQRSRLLARWHPRFGDRRQELVFAGMDLDPVALCVSLDACLLAGEDLGGSLHAAPAEGSAGLATLPKPVH